MPPDGTKGRCGQWAATQRSSRPTTRHPRRALRPAPAGGLYSACRWLAALTSPCHRFGFVDRSGRGKCGVEPCRRTSPRTTHTRARPRQRDRRASPEPSRDMKVWPRRSRASPSVWLERVAGGFGNARPVAARGCSTRWDWRAIPTRSTRCATPALAHTCASHSRPVDGVPLRGRCETRIIRLTHLQEDTVMPVRRVVLSRADPLPQGVAGLAASVRVRP